MLWTYIHTGQSSPCLVPGVISAGKDLSPTQDPGPPNRLWAEGLQATLFSPAQSPRVSPLKLNQKSWERMGDTSPKSPLLHLFWSRGGGPGVGGWRLPLDAWLHA